MHKEPHIIQFKKIGQPSEGYLSICESNVEIPFTLKRTFWTYFTPDGITRGRHAHYETEMVLIALSGIIEIMVELLSGERKYFTLKNPNEGLYLPPFTWHEMTYTHTTVQLVLTSTEYNESDYIRNYDNFKKLQQSK